jgi:hypothetical protein
LTCLLKKKFLPILFSFVSIAYNEIADFIQELLPRWPSIRWTPQCTPNLHFGMLVYEKSHHELLWFEIEWVHDGP